MSTHWRPAVTPWSAVSSGDLVVPEEAATSGFAFVVRSQADDEGRLWVELARADSEPWIGCVSPDENVWVLLPGPMADAAEELREQGMIP